MKLCWLLILCSSLAYSAGIPVWIDTDPSVARGAHEVDDGFALLQAFHSPQLLIRGISVVFGNAPLNVAFPIAQRLVREFGTPGLEVFRGASSGRELGVETDASRALEAALTKDELVVIALGPVTNIATVLRRHPELGIRIKSIVAVAGRRPHQRFVTGSGAQAFRDFNFEQDAPAFQVLLDSKVPLVLTPWEISSKVWLGSKDLATLRSQDKSISWVLDAAADWLTYWHDKLGTAGFNPFDTLAIGYVDSPAGFQCEPLPIAIARLPDDTQSGSAPMPHKPYLLVNRQSPSTRSALYCVDPPPDFATHLLQQIASQSTRESNSLDHSLWNELTQKYVTSGARVNYAALNSEGLPKLDAYLQRLAPPWPADLNASQRKASLINAYNAFTVRWILTNYPIESIWQTKHPFTAARNRLNGETVSLDQIEAQLRALGDPRIHASLVCASRNCPPLRREAYDGARLDAQLDDNFRQWLANTQLNEFFPERHTASISMIFKWYAGDFHKNGNSVETYLTKLGPAGRVQFLSEPGDRLEYKTYNWGLNDTSAHGNDYSQTRFYWDAMRNK